MFRKNLVRMYKHTFDKIIHLRSQRGYTEMREGHKGVVITEEECLNTKPMLGFSDMKVLVVEMREPRG